MKVFKTETIEDFPYTGESTKIVAFRKPMPVFIRFGHFQSETGERSMNWSTGEYERGISVYPASLIDGTAIPDSDWLLDIERAWDLLKDRTRYVLTGRVSGEGADGEPVLVPSSIVVRGVDCPRLRHGVAVNLGE